MISRRKGLSLVFDGLMRALEVGFESVKVNCVVMRDFNDDELLDFCQLAVKYPISVRFIEFMPFAGNAWNAKSFVPFKEMLGRIREKYPDLHPSTGLQVSPHETSKIFRLSDEMLGSIGFIASITDNFCGGCNRLRITADGQLKVCLFDGRETSLRDLIRIGGATDEELVRAVYTALGKKRKQHAGR